MGIIDAIQRVSVDEGVEYLRKYYLAEAGYYTGSEFERIGAEPGVENRFTAADVYSVATLGVNVPARAGVAILESEASKFNGILADVPNDVKIGALSEAEHKQVLGRTSRARELWHRLRRNGPDESRWQVGPTIASKLMARKRPHLIPIEDSVVNRVIKLGQGDSWRLWWETFQAEGDYLEARATKLRAEIGRPELSTLRVFDVMLWMWGQANPSV